MCFRYVYNSIELLTFKLLKIWKQKNVLVVDR